MKSIDRRIRKLENRFSPPENEAERRLLDTLMERRRRRLEASGLLFDERPLAPTVDRRGRRATWAETLRNRRAQRCAEAESRRVEQAAEAQ